jgi:Putative ATP-dependent Lon protease
MDRIHAYLPGWDIPKMNRDLFTDHFGLVSDFMSECMSHLRKQSRALSLQGRVQFGGSLSGRDMTAVTKTVSGLLKLINPDQQRAVAEEDLEWAILLALEMRRRVKEQQKRIGSAEFRNTHFSYTMGENGVEKFVATPELQKKTVSDSIHWSPVRSGPSDPVARMNTRDCTELKSMKGLAQESNFSTSRRHRLFRRASVLRSKISMPAPKCWSAIVTHGSMSLPFNSARLTPHAAAAGLE